MEAWVLNKKYETIGLVDTFKSFIWTERYLGCGNFELYLPYSPEMEQLLVLDNYLSIAESETYMIIETVEIDMSDTDGCMMTVTGRSLEVILERRIAFSPLAAYSNYSQDWKLDGLALTRALDYIISFHVTNPQDGDRVIPGFRYETPTDSSITSIGDQTIIFSHDSVYQMVYNLCDDNDLGFKVLPEGAGGFVMRVYRGVDRSYDQMDRFPVVFSPEYDNLQSEKYIKSDANYKNVVYMMTNISAPVMKLVRDTQPDGSIVTQQVPVNEQKTLLYRFTDNTKDPMHIPSISGLDRREMIFDTSISWDDATVSMENLNKFANYVWDYAKTELAENEAINAFEADLDYLNTQWVYGVDYFVGDVIQVSGHFDKQTKVRITEMVHTHDETGESLVPTFSIIED